jgi:regulator of cell morphogenesis and NO signaling
MSHHPNIISPPGTSTADRTVGELVAERPGRSRVFQDFKIDFCCQGGRTLREACERRDVALESVLEQLEAEQHSNKAPDFNPAELPSAQLADFIVEKHHTFLRQELPRLHMMAERVAHVHGGHTPSLVTIFEVFQGMEDELISHMAKEEQVLFPAIKALEGGQSFFGPLDGPIACMMHEHDYVGSSAGGAAYLEQRILAARRGLQHLPRPLCRIAGLGGGSASAHPSRKFHSFPGGAAARQCGRMKYCRGWGGKTEAVS